MDVVVFGIGNTVLSVCVERVVWDTDDVEVEVLEVVEATTVMLNDPELAPLFLSPP